MSRVYRLARPVLFAFDPERAHGLAIRALSAGLGMGRPAAADPRLRRSLLGLDFPNPLGLSAGFDKNAAVVDGLFGLGFGFVEVGTVTPRPQSGNPQPRLFRLEPDGAIVNRLGFNNEGHDAVHRRLGARQAKGGIVGVNVGANRDSPDRAADFAQGVARFADVAEYLVVNVSSPNTPGLRDLQEQRALADLLGRVNDARGRSARRLPVLLKIAPDLDDEVLAAIVETVMSARIDGMIVSNTTLARDGLAHHHAKEAGGLSGRPLFRRSTAMLAKTRKLAGPNLVLVGVGGIDSAETAWEKIAAGADLIQLYTGLVYEGPGLVSRILAGLAARLDREGLPSIAAVVGTATDRWAAG